MQIQISWLLQKPTDLDLHCLQMQGISGFSRTRVKDDSSLFQLENGRSLKTELQCKFYNESETEHSKWGNKLTSIEYECQVSEGHTYVTVIKERYL